MQGITIWRNNFIRLNSCVFASLPSCYFFYFFRHSNHIIRVITPYLHNFSKEMENIYVLKISCEYKIKQNSTWRELFAIQLALQSFAPKISNKSVCWETDNYAVSLTVTSESNNTGSSDLLVLKVIKHLKTSKSQNILLVRL